MQTMDANQAFVRYVKEIRRGVHRGSPFFLYLTGNTATIEAEYSPFEQCYRFSVAIRQFRFMIVLSELACEEFDEDEVLTRTLESIRRRIDDLLNNHDEQEVAPRPSIDIFDQLAGIDTPITEGQPPRRARPTAGRGQIHVPERSIDPSQQVTLALVTLMYKKLLLTTPEYEAIEKTIKNSGSLDELLFVIESINKGEF